MEQVGLVTKINGSKMELEVRRISGCGGGCSSCSSSCDTPGHMVVLPNNLNAKVGDLVEIKANSKNLLKFTAIVYIIPLIFFIAGTAISTVLLKEKMAENYELASFGLGILSMALSFIIIRQFDKKVGTKGNEALTATKIL